MIGLAATAICKSARPPYVRALVHLDSALTDVVGVYTWTATNSSYDTTVKKFGPASISFNNASAAKIGTDGITVWPSGYTLDFWFYVPTASTGKANLVATRSTLVNYAGLVIDYNCTDNKLAIYMSSTGSSWNIQFNGRSTNAISRDAWHHLAFVWSGSAYKTYIDGSVENTVTTASGLLAPVGIFVGGNGTDEGSQAKFDEIRFCNIPVWLANFSVPTAPYL